MIGEITPFSFIKVSHYIANERAKVLYCHLQQKSPKLKLIRVYIYQDLTVNFFHTLFALFVVMIGH